MDIFDNNQMQQDCSGLYDSDLENLIELALVDGELTEKERQVLLRHAQAKGIDTDEFDMVLDARLYKKKQEQRPIDGTPKSDKYGDVKKCPACGAMVSAFTTRCPECGHDFSNIAANSSIQKLFEMLNQVEAESSDADTFIGGLSRMLVEELTGGSKVTKQKRTIIQNFPIPTTKDDILEFLALAIPLAKKPSIFSQDKNAREMYPIWKAKCEQIIMKAKFSMVDDQKTLEMIREYADKLNIKM